MNIHLFLKDLVINDFGGKYILVCKHAEVKNDQIN